MKSVAFHLALPVHDLAEARRFYGEVLGCVEGSVEEGILPSGSGVGLVRELPTVSALIDELMATARGQAEALTERLGARTPIA